MSIQATLDPTALPRHIAIIMDGNGRWARQRGNARLFGHRSAVKAVRDTTEGAAELGIDFLTLFAFSTENWQRPQLEVSGLMGLLVDTLKKEKATLMDNDIRLSAIGDLSRLPGTGERKLREMMELTQNNQRMVLTLALSYGSRADMVAATQRLADKVAKGQLQPNDIDERLFSESLSTAGMPDPELLVRTSGEYRISNFLLWEIAYSEIFFTPKLWPDFRREDLFAAIADYQRRERRFGKISEQLQ